VSNNAWSQRIDADTVRRRAGDDGTTTPFGSSKRCSAQGGGPAAQFSHPKERRPGADCANTGVSRATISRDIAFLRNESLPCPCCGRFRFAVDR
jgi:hypothetical protein